MQRKKNFLKLYSTDIKNKQRKGEKDMKRLNMMENEKQLKEVKGGWDRCKICGSTVKGNFAKKYAHCVKHAWNSVKPIVELVGICFGVVK